MAASAFSNVISLVNSEADHLRDFLGSLSADQWSHPSACADWALGDVVAHITQGADTWSECITRAVAGDASPPEGLQPLRPGDRGSQATADRAIQMRDEKGPVGLLAAFGDGYDRLRQVMSTLTTGDQDKPCFHRRGIMSVYDYVGVRLQELAIHGWDIRYGLDTSAQIWDDSLPVLVDRVPRWLRNTFQSEPKLAAPIRYRFHVTGAAPVKQDVVVTADGYAIEPTSDTPANVTFNCNSSEYILLIYGRLNLDQASTIGDLRIEGNREQATMFNTWFKGV